MHYFHLLQRKQDGWTAVNVVLECEWFINKLTYKISGKLLINVWNTC